MGSLTKFEKFIDVPATHWKQEFQPAMHMPLGTATFEDADQLVPFQKDASTFYICGGDDADTPPLGVKDDQHVMVVGGTRTGKGTSVLVNNAVLWNGSALFIDPKGENATVTARRRADGSDWCFGLRQTVHLLDPFSVAGRDDDDLNDLRSCFNPLDTVDIDDENSIDQVTAIADALIAVENDKDPYWENAARNLVKVVTLHVLSSDEFDQDQRNLVTVQKLLASGDREKREFLEEIGADQISTAHSLLFSSMTANTAFDGLIASAGEQYANMANEAMKQFMGVIETVNRKLEFIESPSMQRTLACSDFALSDLKTDEHGVSVYLCLPQRAMETHSGWLRLMVTLTVNTMERVKQQPACGAPVLMMLDEFAGLKRMRVIETAIAQLAGYGVKLVFGVQNFPQLKEIYKDAWEGIAGNCGIKMILSAEDQFTREYVSKLAGETEVIRTTQTKSHGDNASHTFTTSNGTSTQMGRNSSYNFKGGMNWGRSNGSGDSYGHSEASTEGNSFTRGENETTHKRYLLNPDEIGRLCSPMADNSSAHYPGRMLVLKRGCNPMVLKRCNYFEGAYFVGLYDPHPDHPYPPTLIELLSVLPPAIPEPLLLPVVVPAPPPPTWKQRLRSWFIRYRLMLLGLITAILVSLLAIYLFIESWEMIFVIVLVFLFPDALI